MVKQKNRKTRTYTRRKRRDGRITERVQVAERKKKGRKKMKNEIAVVEQLPKIIDKMEEIGADLEKRLEELKLDDLICTEETRKGITDLRTSLKKEQTEFENQRKNIKNEIMAPYEEFNKIYDVNIKSKYTNAITVLTEKIAVVENTIRENTKIKMIEFFEEKRNASNIKPEWLSFDELNIKIGINQLTPKGEIVKKVKDEINDAVDTIKTCIDTINSMQDKEEILVEYLKHKNLQMAIKEVNDRHEILSQVQRDYEAVEEIQVQEEQAIEKVNEVLEAPIEGQMSIDDFEEEVVQEPVKGLFIARFEVLAETEEALRDLVNFMRERGIKYESIE